MTFIAYPGDNMVIPLGKYTIRYLVDNNKEGRYYDGVFLVGAEPDTVNEIKVFIKDTEDLLCLQRMLREHTPKDGFFFQIDVVYTPPSSGWILLFGLPHPEL